MALSLYHDTYAAQNPSGQSQNLVLLHGWGMNSLVWDKLVPILNQNHHITLIDLPGFGRSPMPGGDYDLDYLIAHIKDIHQQAAVWIGWSLGGLIVQALAKRDPALVQSAIVIGGTPKFVAADNWPSAMSSEVFQQFYDLLQEDWRGTLIRFLTLQCKGSETIREDTKFMKELLFHHGLPATKALREGLNVLRHHDLREDLREIKVPIKYILGEHDHLVPRTIAPALQDLNETLNTEIISAAAHAPHVSHPEATAAVIEDFIAMSASVKAQGGSHE